MDFAVARQNMVESQIRTNRVTDPRILEAMRELPREQFLPKNRRHLAYVDEDVQLGEDRWLIEPMVLGRMLQAATVQRDEIALVVGAGVGYSTAVVSRLAATVFALETDPDLAARSGSLLSSLGIDNAVVVEGPLAVGWPAEAPYDVILINGAVYETPHALFEQLRDGGRLVTVVRRDEAIGRVVLYMRHRGVVSHRTMFDAATPFLPDFAPKPGFVF